MELPAQLHTSRQVPSLTTHDQLHDGRTSFDRSLPCTCSSGVPIPPGLHAALAKMQRWAGMSPPSREPVLEIAIVQKVQLQLSIVSMYIHL
jgi:hypothetical protein